IDKQRLKEKICHIDDELQQEVDCALRVSLELDT
ncbi:MAG TPA: PemK family transcriptional regulator, partial [Clostridium sp.]|nr:PemK family transcriptional regulator [Clostridium sp.]